MTCINYINHFCIKLIELSANQYQDSLFFIQRKVYISINYKGLPLNKVMLVTMLCWRFYDDDSFEMLAVIFMFSLALMTFSIIEIRCQESAINISQLSPTSGTNINEVLIWVISYTRPSNLDPSLIRIRPVHMITMKTKNLWSWKYGQTNF